MHNDNVHPPTTTEPPDVLPVNAVRRAMILKGAAEGGLLGVQVLNKLMKPVAYADPDVTPIELASAVMDTLLADFAPRNAAEKMLVEQLAVTHVQLLALHGKLASASDQHQLERLAIATSRLQADFRKTLAALQTWRSPMPNIHAQQLNLAQQQFVQHHGA
jgi:hypothetical protein